MSASTSSSRRILGCPCCGGSKYLSSGASSCSQCGWNVEARVANRWSKDARESWSAMATSLREEYGEMAEREAFERMRSEHD